MNMLWTGFLLGLAGSLHCIAMCGPLVAGFNGNSTQGITKALSGKLVYNSGRIISYVLIGLTFGALGQVISLFAYQQTISVISGILLLIWAIGALGFVKLKTSNIISKYWPKLASGAYNKLRSYPKPLARFGAGMVNGFLPCGLVYLAATAAAHRGEVSYSMLYMMFFGLGTLPAMLGLAVFIGALKTRWKQYLSSAVPYFTCFIAILFILRGLALDIPYISPKIESGTRGEIQNNCCHKH